MNHVRQVTPREVLSSMRYRRLEWVRMVIETQSRDAIVGVRSMDSQSRQGIALQPFEIRKANSPDDQITSSLHRRLLDQRGLIPPAAAETFLVKDGKPHAEIVIADNPPRSTRLAAHELKTSIEKISGAKLSISTKPSTDVPVQVYVGESPHAEKLGVTAEGLKHGAYRIVSGENWLVLIGDDTDFVPIEPWAKNNGDRQTSFRPAGRKPAGCRMACRMAGCTRIANACPKELAKEDGEYLWAFDERGSYNAVCGFLRSLGVRWYLPGELGEVVPKMASIPLPKIDETAEPDFEIRQFSVRFGTADDEVMRWAMRLGIRQTYGLMIAHGMHTMTHPDALKTQHPEWFALYGGKRDTQTGKRLNHLCYSNEELFDATVKWARAQFDVYDYEAVSIMPPDAYGSICQCELCEGKQVDEMGSRGKLSNHVWDFANRVAKEVGKTHPDKLIACCAYGANTLPPTNIDKLEPNVQVVIVGGRRPRNSLPEQREYVRSLRAGWLEKTDRPIIVFENYPFTGRGTYLPGFVARTNGESINATKGISRGEDIWLSFPRYHDDPNIGFDHFQVYFTARMWWGGKDADVEALLDEYCRLFYGPAGSKMKEFFDYCEVNYQAMEQEKEKIDTALAMFEAAKASVSQDSVYAKRLALIDRFLDALRSKARTTRPGPRSRPETPHRLGTTRADQDRRETRRTVLGQTSAVVRRPAYASCKPAAGRSSERRSWRAGTAAARTSISESAVKNEPGEEAERHRDKARRSGSVLRRRGGNRTRHRQAQLLSDCHQSSGCDRRSGSQHGPAVRLAVAGRSGNARCGRSLDDRDPHPCHRR